MKTFSTHSNRLEFRFMNFKNSVSFVHLFSDFVENMRPSRKQKNIDHFAKNFKSEGL